MAVSKRLRFEVLKRDNHTCRYCGRSAPEVKLHVDHVVPASLGGTDAPSNLVTACADCNNGKSSTSAAEGTVPPPTLDSLRWTKAVEDAAVDRRRHRWDMDEARGHFQNRWPGHYLPDDWGASVDKFIRMGLGPMDIDHFLERALERTENLSHTWNYFCKVCWSEVKTIRARAAAVLAEETDTTTVYEMPAVPVVDDTEDAVEERPVAPEPPVYREPDYDMTDPPWFDPAMTRRRPCIECDERPAELDPYDGFCLQCRRFHYTGSQEGY